MFLRPLATNGALRLALSGQCNVPVIIFPTDLVNIVYFLDPGTCILDQIKLTTPVHV